MFGVAPGIRIVGIQLPIQAQSNYFVGGWEPSCGPAEMARIAQLCDRTGYAYLGVCDHVTLPESVVGGMGTHWVDPIATLGWLAGVTERIMLLSHVYVLPYRHPLIAAKQFATLDHLSGGRVIVGVGAGHVQAEFEHLGVDFRARGRMVNEALPVLEAALRDEFVDGFGARPRPTQSPRPPIWVAGSSEAAIRRAGRFADGWLPQSPSNDDMIDLLLAERDQAGRSSDPIVIGHITPPMYVGTPSWDVGPGVLTGSPESLAEQLLATAPDRANQLQVRCKAQSLQELLDQLEAFGEAGLPLLTTI